VFTFGHFISPNRYFSPSMRKYLTLFFVIGCCSCKSFNYGLTQKKAFGHYNLVTGNGSSFGDKRLKYNLGHHRNSSLSAFVQQRGKPDFIYEYEDAEKRDGIHLYYVNADSAYCFIEAYKNKPFSSISNNCRKMTEEERNMYKRLLQKK
jgi:hypothetical protein